MDQHVQIINMSMLYCCMCLVPGNTPVTPDTPVHLKIRLSVQTFKLCNFPALKLFSVSKKIIPQLHPQNITIDDPCVIRKPTMGAPSGNVSSHVLFPTLTFVWAVQENQPRCIH